MLTAYAPVAPLGWLVFVELPVEEAYAPLYASILRSGVLLLAALMLAVLAGISWRAGWWCRSGRCSDGAARIGSGDLDQRIAIKTGDELEALGDQFNSMAAQLQESYATLERKVEERTQQLELANLAKSRFLAAASHDLRQPLARAGPVRRAAARPHERGRDASRLVERIDAAGCGDERAVQRAAGYLQARCRRADAQRHRISRSRSCCSGSRRPSPAPAREKGLSLRVVPSSAWVRSDFILLERILLNLVSNAVRYTSRGGVVVGCRRRGEQLRIEVWDTRRRHSGGPARRTSSASSTGSAIRSAISAAGLGSGSPSSTACAGCSAIRSS